MDTATRVVAEKVRMSGPFFDYTTETCVTGMVLALGSYFLPDATPMPQPEVLLARQRDDGGWNCKVTSDRSSFHTTISALEGLLEYERAVGGDAGLAAARHRAHEYFLDRRLMYSLRTGELVNSRWLLMSFPPRWHYDVLRCLDYLRDAGVTPDARCDEAVAADQIEATIRRNLAACRPARRSRPLRDGGPGKPSRWNTLRALRVLAWHDA